MRIALAQINPTVGDLAGNSRHILSFIARAKEAGAELVVFPELALVGYPPRDLLLKRQFIEDTLRALHLIASRVHGIDAVIGYAEPNRNPVGRPLHNAVALLREGRIFSRHYKTLLPTYDVFDESRYFEPGPQDERENLVQIGATTIGLSICEDLWNDEKLIPHRLYHQNPIAELMAAGAQVLINSSASPFVVGKHEFRIELFGGQARHFGKPIVYVNQVGGNDDLVFDGNSCVFDATGRHTANAKAFEEDLLVVEVGGEGSGFRVRGSGGEDERQAGLDQPLLKADGDKIFSQSPSARPREDTGFRIRATDADDAQHAPQPSSLNPEPRTLTTPTTLTTSSDLESMYKAIVLGLRDYVRKCGFKSVVLGLSGGIDSALTAALAVDALGKDKVVGVAMPSRFSSDHSVNDARSLAENLGIEFHVVPIKDVHETYEQLLMPYWAGRERDVTEENLQARVRGAILMAFSNKFNHLLLTTGNKSELAVGYCTLYGDMCGGLAVISDVPKTAVWAMSRWINQTAGREIIPQSSIEKVPSAELRPDQTDQDSLPPYDVLDAILFRYIEQEEGAAEIIAAGFDPETVIKVIKLTDRSEYKRRQAAPGLKVTSRAFGTGRRMPIAQRYMQIIPKHGEPSPVEGEQKRLPPTQAE